MDSEELTVEELEAKRRMYAHLAQGAADVKAGRVQPLDDAIDEIIRELDTVAARILKEYKAAFEELGK